MSIPTSEKEQNAKLMAELAREEARNAEAIRMVKEKELQALAAKDRAADSQRRMQDMMVRYEEMKQKLEWTRLTLEHTASQINQNDIKRAQQIQATVSRLKEKAEHCSGILKRKRERDGLNAISENQEDTDAFGADTGNSLTEVEKKLFRMLSQTTLSPQETLECKAKYENEGSSAHDIASVSTQPSDIPNDHAHNDSSLTDAEKMLLLMCQNEKSEKMEEKENVEDISVNNNASMPQIKNNQPETSKDTSADDLTSETVASKLVGEEKKEFDHEEGNKDLNNDIKESDSAVITVDALDTIEYVEPKVNTAEKEEGSVEAEEFDLKEVTKDLKETVTNIEAKCAGVRDELGQMAMSEQYMRTKQAQLLAKRKEKEAEKALEAASIKELEAQQMRQKVANMMKLLEERKNKLKQSEDVLDKRANLVDKVNKVLDSKLRKADFVQKQRDECLAFDIKHKPTTEKEHSNENEPENNETSDDQEISKAEEEQDVKESDEECQLSNQNSSTTSEKVELTATEDQNRPTLEANTTNESNGSQL
jgi:hypothetical protein